MPTVTETPVKAYAHCTRPTCRPGMYQEEVDAQKVITSYSYLDNGGDIPGEERSHERLRFVRDDDAVCSHCGAHRELSATHRPQYQNISGHDPMGLLGMPAFDPSLSFSPDDEAKAKIEALEKQVLALTEAMTKGDKEG